MAKYWGRMLGRPETIRSFEASCDDHAPDEYVHQFLKAESCGVAFVEIARVIIGKTIAEDAFGPWRLWRVELLDVTDEALLLLTGECTEAEAMAEIDRHAFAQKICNASAEERLLLWAARADELGVEVYCPTCDGTCKGEQFHDAPPARQDLVKSGQPPKKDQVLDKPDG